MYKKLSRGICLPFLYLSVMTSTGFSQGQGSDNVQLLINVNTRSSAGYNDCWGYTAPDGREYALLGVINGTSIIDITDAPNASEVAFIPSAGSPWKDIKTFGHFAYVVTEANTTMQIIDLANLPASASQVGTFSGFETHPHNVFVDPDMKLLYGIEDQNFGKSVRVLSLDAPLNPVDVALFDQDSHDVFAQDSVLYVAEANEHSIGIFDMRDPVSHKLITRVPIANAGYVHNVWVSEDNNYMITTEETVGKTVKLWDIRDLNNVEIASEFLGPGQLAHNAFIKNGFAYISHYKDGLRIVDLSDPTQMQEVGFFDTFLGTSQSPFGGAWGAYPFFNSNKILISDVLTGLYVVEFQPTPVSVEEQQGAPQRFTLSQNYPNPFNPTTTIDYSLPQASHVKVDVFNLRGQQVRTLVDEIKAQGTYQTVWDGSDDAGRQVSSGLYIYRLEAGDFIENRRMLFLK